MKAVIPAAGLGTRFLPATKAQPKEMLPVMDKPAIQYVVEEAVESEIEDILIITGRGKRAIEDHFDKSIELEGHLWKTDKMKELGEIQRIGEMANIYYVRQKEPLGLGHAVSCAKEYVRDEPFAVLLGDDIVIGEIPCTKQLISIFEKRKKSVIAVETVPQELAGYYGIVDVEKEGGNLYRVRDVVEKPADVRRKSNLAILGRYVLLPDVFECIERVVPDSGGEIQLTDAIRILLEESEVYALKFEGKRYDIGSRFGWLRANIEFALQREDISEKFMAYMRKRFETS